MSKPQLSTSPLIDRKQAEIILKTSYSTLRRMERDGTLTPVKLRPTKQTAKTHYRKDQVYALIGEPLPKADA
ncbi:hypothetical protein JQ620_15365 [Bradyrhizobium sp. AUGA SZCCT0274]|uniref:hypothetical protein n=1 Tax=Bradyrhizobium sp. AUGA SZCCT0274 TaxID=2807670 RepID=UPI001BA7DE7D|nr:hypothetical protein [Bradyrhizobium sp. AUGA SZCCT0274]MBR1241508.1 hypothetical protein [Bradyrhizobium sp. AUGA SZCCT0274]